MINFEFEEILEQHAIKLEDMIAMLESNRMIDADDMIEELREMLKEVQLMLGYEEI